MLNRRDFFKKLGLVAGAAAVLPFVSRELFERGTALTPADLRRGIDALPTMTQTIESVDRQFQIALLRNARKAAPYFSAMPK